MAPLAPQSNQLVCAAGSEFAPAANGQANYKNLLAGGLARGVAFSLLALAVAPFILTAPAHATDDNTVSIEVDQNATLKPTGALYKATTNITVTTGKPYGFNLTLHATGSPDLVNQKDDNHRIKSLPVSNDSASLAANQWGYNTYNSNMYFYGVPDGSSPAVIADVTKAKPAGCTNPANCIKQVTFAANVDSAKLASGSYSTAIIYTTTVKPTPKPAPIPMAKLEPARGVNLTVCRSGDPKNDCQVDLDPNMIPVKYTGSIYNAEWTSIAKPEDSSNQGNWYNYNNKQWANAITVKPWTLSKYKGQNRVVNQADILGFWVYIPRYAYEVMRRDGTDKPVSAQNFLISFEKKTTPKRHPAACNTTGKDYRTQCDLDRSYIKGQPSNQGTWATHPAFTFGTKELNGIWFAKFETTGTTDQPTVLPNEAHMSSGYDASRNIGRMYTTAKTLGVADSNNVGGETDYSIPAQNNHHLAKLSSHMVNNNDWGAATYLSASKYGAGYNGVQINSSAAEHTTYGWTYSVTGCGPWENGNTDSYGNSNDSWITHKGISVGSLGTQQACSTDNPQRAYNGTLGQLASTTNNPAGIYDMSGGGWEYTASSYTTNLNESGVSDEYGDYFGTKAYPPYVSTYNITNLNSCTFSTCGGQALYETLGWNGNYSSPVTSSYPLFRRGGNYYYGSHAGLFVSNPINGYNGGAFRVALAPLRD